MITAQHLIEAFSEANLYDRYMFIQEPRESVCLVAFNGYWDLEAVARVLNQKVGYERAVADGAGGGGVVAGDAVDDPAVD